MALPSRRAVFGQMACAWADDLDVLRSSARLAGEAV
eukprot:UN4853